MVSLCPRSRCSIISVHGQQSGDSGSGKAPVGQRGILWHPLCAVSAARASCWWLPCAGSVLSLHSAHCKHPFQRLAAGGKHIWETSGAGQGTESSPGCSGWAPLPLQGHQGTHPGTTTPLPCSVSAAGLYLQVLFHRHVFNCYMSMKSKH